MNHAGLIERLRLRAMMSDDAAILIEVADALRDANRDLHVRCMHAVVEERNRMQSVLRRAHAITAMASAD